MLGQWVHQEAYKTQTIINKYYIANFALLIPFFDDAPDPEIDVPGMAIEPPKFGKYGGVCDVGRKPFPVVRNGQITEATEFQESKIE